MTVINCSQTLWQVAYKEDHKLTGGSVKTAKNLAAARVFERHSDEVFFGKFFVIIASILFVLGISLALTFSLSSSLVAWSYAEKMVALGTIFTLMGITFSVLGSLKWCPSSKRLREYQTKPLSEVKKNLGEDLAEVEQNACKNRVENENLLRDVDVMYDALRA
jgi:hypothetical protein